MKNINKNIGLYFIIDGAFTRDFLGLTKLAINADLKIIQYRDKNVEPLEMLKNAIKIQELTEKSDTIFIVNDNVDVALKSNADGVHIGQKDEKYENVRKLLPDKIIGLSTENIEQSLIADKIGADYLGVGPIFSTPTKPDAAPPIGVKKLAEIVKSTTTPIVAIGGINHENLENILETGVNGVAIISAILAARNPEKEVRKITSIIKRFRERNPL
ncbi:MAG: thiamine phosphate synthase [Candidatus Cloacimonetes bacterium]|nr:thiamine phosphate synthase [Candidatus Cloacimonadota bacterium]